MKSSIEKTVILVAIPFYEGHVSTLLYKFWDLLFGKPSTCRNPFLCRACFNQGYNPVGRQTKNKKGSQSLFMKGMFQHGKRYKYSHSYEYKYCRNPFLWRHVSTKRKEVYVWIVERALSQSLFKKGMFQLNF